MEPLPDWVSDVSHFCFNAQNCGDSLPLFPMRENSELFIYDSTCTLLPAGFWGLAAVLRLESFTHLTTIVICQRIRTIELEFCAVLTTVEVNAKEVHLEHCTKVKTITLLGPVREMSVNNSPEAV